MRVFLRPPIELTRPASARVVPEPDAMPGGCMYQPKLDGFRAAAFALPEGPMLQSRTGRDLTGRFPELAGALAVPVGTVLDGEIVAWRGARLSRGELMRSPAARRAAGVEVRFVAFDCLAVADRRGARDVRALALEQRWQLLTNLLAAVPPPIELVMATTDRDTAMIWFESLPQIGVEGLVIKPLAGTYGGLRWVKVRHPAPASG